MRTVTAVEAKTRLGELLDQVAGGEEILITRHEKPVARLIPAQRDMEKVRATVEGLRKLQEEQRREMTQPLMTWEEIKAIANEGRK